ncbi:Aste57867_23137 [Aphanomyces stellatus]|uniref:Aste57867_23137 protein n=1 Tax=Aphanomyces stellatus TaxID=120398 RepID=A0A485LMR3_9STRA|nr:hypothetical protein As57867_023066 [Aphanomyces stellatus]VFT99785.1 Aste57867_23137 [Aphanomyces stellatus]
MEALSISSVGIRRTASSGHGSVGRSSSSVRQPKQTNDSSRYKLSEGAVLSDENNEAEEGKYPEPTKMHRPKEWSPEVEEAFRIQQTGWRDINDYRNKYGEPERWENGFVRCTRVKASGYYTYWRNTRECEDKHLNKVKVFEY